jgi:hypothetical protein
MWIDIHVTLSLFTLALFVYRSRFMRSFNTKRIVFLSHVVGTVLSMILALAPWGCFIPGLGDIGALTPNFWSCLTLSGWALLMLATSKCWKAGVPEHFQRKRR